MPQNCRKDSVICARALMKVRMCNRQKIAEKRLALDEKENTMVDTLKSCTELDAIYAAKRDAGLVDVKFLLRNAGDASSTEIEHELVEIQKAIDAGKIKDLDFGDLRWKKAS